MVLDELRVPVGLVVGFVTVLIAVGGAQVLGGRARIVWIAALAGWLGLTAAVALSGVLARTDGPPVMMLVVAPAIITALLVARSSIGERLAELPLVALIAVHGFRLPLELAMHAGAGRGVPIELTFAGYNFDIVTGSGALVLAALVAARRAPRWLVLAWTYFGLACLAVIAVVAVATLPRVHVFGTDPAHLNTWVAEVPFVWVPALLVPVALGGHLLVLRAMRSKPSSG